MSDDEWDRDDFEVPVKTPAKWDDDEEEVKDSWDADSEDEQPKPTPKAPTPRAPKKKTLAEKIAEKELKKEQERKKREALAAETEETEYERKMRLQQSVVESDLENIKALVGDVDLNPKAIGVLAGKNIATMEPKSRADFEEYIKMNSTLYPFFVESVVREMVVALNVDDTRKISSSITAMINEKQKAIKESQGKGKKKANTKKSVAVSRGLDMTNYDDEPYDEFADFM